MKKCRCFYLLSLLSILVLLISGCNDANQYTNSYDKDDSELESDAELSQDSQGEDVDEEMPYKLVWQKEKDLQPIKVPYTVPSINYNVPNYTIQTDLSNIENIKRFEGFTKRQKEQLAKNGFIVLPPKMDWGNLQMYGIYDTNMYSNIDSFVTVDAVMHLYHVYYDGTLKIIEKEYLMEELTRLTDSMLHKSLMLYQDSAYESVKKDLKFNAVFFAVAKKLLTQAYGDIPEDIKTIADEEVKRISTANEYQFSTLLEREVDYSQFKVRGHYTEDENYENYFRAMMWYGMIGLPLTQGQDDYVEICVDETVKALLMTYTAFIQNEGRNDIEAWDKIYWPTNFYIGQSDDLDLYDYKTLIVNVFGTEVNPNDFRNESYYKKLLEEAKKLPKPGIVHKTTHDIPNDRQFRFMGQRYTFDGEILQELMHPYYRPVPSALDVAGVLGSQRAKELLDEYEEPQKHWVDYEDTFIELKDKIEQISEETWQANIYNGWLWTLSSIQDSFEGIEGIPLFMNNKAWTDKSISSALGSYAELKHDTILYVKQPVAQCGNEDLYEHHHYVEPNVNVYSKLIWLTEYSITNLEAKGLIPEQFERVHDKVINLLTLLQTCSIKELNNERLSKEEQSKLSFFGGEMDSIIYDIITQCGSSKLKCSGVIADIATCGGGCLEIGTGLPHEIYVVTQEDSKLYLTKGAVYGYYEFYNDTRLNDDEWHEMLGVRKESFSDHPDEDYFMIKIGEPSPDLPKQPEWLNSFLSQEENHITIKVPEVQFE